jgi:hypothetical protein
MSSEYPTNCYLLKFVKNSWKLAKGLLNINTWGGGKTGRLAGGAGKRDDPWLAAFSGASGLTAPVAAGHPAGQTGWAEERWPGREPDPCVVLRGVEARSKWRAAGSPAAVFTLLLIISCRHFANKIHFQSWKQEISKLTKQALSKFYEGVE